MWPGFLAVWAAIILHLGWVALLLEPGSRAYLSTPVFRIWELSGESTWRSAALLTFVAATALFGLGRKVDPLLKIVYLMPQQLVLGISAAGAMHAMTVGHYADQVARPWTFIAADQLAVVLTWLGHTAALMLLFFIHQHRITDGGRPVPNGGA